MDLSPCYREGKLWQKRDFNILIRVNERDLGRLLFILPALPPGPANSPILVLIYAPFPVATKFYRLCRDSAESLNNHIFTVIKSQIPQIPKCYEQLECLYFTLTSNISRVKEHREIKH